MLPIASKFSGPRLPGFGFPLLINDEYDTESWSDLPQIPFSQKEVTLCMWICAQVDAPLYCILCIWYYSKSPIILNTRLPSLIICIDTFNFQKIYRLRAIYGGKKNLGTLPSWVSSAAV